MRIACDSHGARVVVDLGVERVAVQLVAGDALGHLLHTQLAALVPCMELVHAAAQVLRGRQDVGAPCKVFGTGGRHLRSAWLDQG